MASSAGRSILVVDDDQDAGQNLVDILVDLGYVVGVATDGFRALEMVKTQQYEIALLDLKMPKMDGLTLATRLKEHSCSMVVILTTAFANQATLDSALSRGIWRVFPKPLDLHCILPCLIEIAEQPTVLLVDDDASMCLSLSDVLRDEGYRVCFVNDFEQAILQIHNSSFQIILIDMKLPGGFGDELFQKVRTTSHGARFILTTGYRHEMEGRIRKSLETGATGVCYKPFELPELLKTLKRLVSQSGCESTESARHFQELN